MPSGLASGGPQPGLPGNDGASLEQENIAMMTTLLDLTSSRNYFKINNN